MKRTAAFLSVVVLLSACDMVGSTQGDALNVTGEPDDALMGVDVAGAAACARENATAEELVVITEGGEAAQALMTEIMMREGTLTCISEKGIQGPGVGG